MIIFVMIVLSEPADNKYFFDTLTLIKSRDYEENIFLVLVFATGAVVAVCSLQVKERDTFLDANVEALAQQESGGADNNYRFEREDGKCRINVGVGGKIILKRTGLILNANTNGYVEFDGKVACKLGGSYECRTIECVDLYQVIFD